MYVCVTVIFTCDDASWCGVFITWTSPVGWWYVLGISTAGVGSFWVVSCSVSGARNKQQKRTDWTDLTAGSFFGGEAQLSEIVPFCGLGRPVSRGPRMCDLRMEY